MNLDALKQLIAYCRRSRDRYVGRSSDGLPSDWCPHKVPNPDMPEGFYFSDDSAWNYIADRLEEGHHYDEIIMHTPAGARAIVLQVALNGSDKPLYIKIQIGSGNKPIGRSFHLSHR